MKKCKNGIAQISVKASNGKRSILFDSLVNHFDGNLDSAKDAYVALQSIGQVEEYDENGEITLTNEIASLLQSSPKQFAIPVAKTTVPKFYTSFLNVLGKTHDEFFRSESQAGGNIFPKLVELSADLKRLKKIDSLSDEEDYIDVLNAESIRHEAWIKSLINSPTIVPAQVLLAWKYINTWNELDEIIYPPELLKKWQEDKAKGINVDFVHPHIERIKGTFQILESSFIPLLEKAVVQEANDRGLKLEDVDLDGKLKNTDFGSFMFLGLNRSPQMIAKLVSKIIHDAEISKVEDVRTLFERLDVLKKKGINPEELVSDSNTILDFVNDDYYDDRSAAFKSKNYPIFVKKNNVQIDLDKFFDIDGVPIYNDVDVSNLSLLLAGNNSLVKFIESSLDEQSKRIKKFNNWANAYSSGFGEDWRIHIAIDANEQLILDEIELRNPFLFKDKLNTTGKTRGTYIATIPSNIKHYNTDFLAKISDSNYYDVWKETKEIREKLVNVLPKQYSDFMKGGKLPVVHKNLIKQQANKDYLSYVSKDFIKQQMKEFKDGFYAFEVKDNTDIPVRFTGRDLEDQRIIGKDQQSKDVFETLKHFGVMAYHYSHFIESKPLITSIQSLLAIKEPIQFTSDGKPVSNKGILKRFTKGTGLQNLRDQIDHEVSTLMYLNRTKPEVPLWKTSSSENIDVIVNLNSTERFTFADIGILDIELALINRVNPVLKQSLIERKKNQIKASWKHEAYESIEVLINFYEERIREAELMTDADLKLKELTRWYDRLKLLNHRTVYASKGIDFLIRYKRLVTMGLSPMAAVRNVVQAYIAATTHAAGGVDFDSKSFHSALKITNKSLTKLFRGGDGNIKKVANIMVKLQQIDTPFDLQGLDEKSWEKWAYKLIGDSENYMRSTIVTAHLIHADLWDKFDENGEWIGAEKEWNSPVTSERTEWLALITKLQRVNTLIMGDTRNLKMLNRSVLGRAIGQFKASWFPEFVANRFGSEQYDYQLDRNVKGYYRTAGDLGLIGSVVGVMQVWHSYFNGNDLYKQIRNTKGNVMSPTDVENLRKVAKEMQYILQITSLVMMLSWLVDDEEDDNLKALEYFLLNESNMLLNELAGGMTAIGAIDDLITSGNIIPAWSIVNDWQKLIMTSTRYLYDDDVEFNNVLTKAMRITPFLRPLVQIYNETQKPFN